MNQIEMPTDQSLDQLAFRFFKLFARYEATLKEYNYFRVERKDRIVVDWTRFAKEVVGAHFIDDLGDKAESANYILQHPPMKQAANDNGKIIWQEVSKPDRTAQTLFGHICRMRNNLFHGAKFNGTWFDPDRSKVLLEHGLVILEHYWNEDSAKMISNRVARDFSPPADKNMKNRILLGHKNQS